MTGSELNGYTIRYNLYSILNSLNSSAGILKSFSSDRNSKSDIVKTSRHSFTSDALIAEYDIHYEFSSKSAVSKQSLESANSFVHIWGRYLQTLQSSSNLIKTSTSTFTSTAEVYALPNDNKLRVDAYDASYWVKGIRSTSTSFSTLRKTLFPTQDLNASVQKVERPTIETNASIVEIFALSPRVSKSDVTKKIEQTIVNNSYVYLRELLSATSTSNLIKTELKTFNSNARIADPVSTNSANVDYFTASYWAKEIRSVASAKTDIQKSLLATQNLNSSVQAVVRQTVSTKASIVEFSPYFTTATKSSVQSSILKGINTASRVTLEIEKHVSSDSNLVKTKEATFTSNAQVSESLSSTVVRVDYFKASYWAKGILSPGANSTSAILKSYLVNKDLNSSVQKTVYQTISTNASVIEYSNYSTTQPKASVQNTLSGAVGSLARVNIQVLETLNSNSIVTKTILSTITSDAKVSPPLDIYAAYVDLFKVQHWVLGLKETIQTGIVSIKKSFSGEADSNAATILTVRETISTQASVVKFVPYSNFNIFGSVQKQALESISSKIDVVKNFLETKSSDSVVTKNITQTVESNSKIDEFYDKTKNFNIDEYRVNYFVTVRSAKDAAAAILKSLIPVTASSQIDVQKTLTSSRDSNANVQHLIKSNVYITYPLSPGRYDERRTFYDAGLRYDTKYVELRALSNVQKTIVETLDIKSSVVKTLLETTEVFSDVRDTFTSTFDSNYAIFRDYSPAKKSDRHDVYSLSIEERETPSAFEEDVEKRKSQKTVEIEPARRMKTTLRVYELRFEKNKQVKLFKMSLLEGRKKQVSVFTLGLTERGAD